MLEQASKSNGYRARGDVEVWEYSSLVLQREYWKDNIVKFCPFANTEAR